MVRDEDVRSARTHATRPLHEEPRVAESESADERQLERAGDVLLRALAEETSHPLRDVEHEKDPHKDREEDQRAQPGPDETPLLETRPRGAGAAIGALRHVGDDRQGTNSSAPMSQPAPVGRGSPSKSVDGTPLPHVPASTSGDVPRRCGIFANAGSSSTLPPRLLKVSPFSTTSPRSL